MIKAHLNFKYIDPFHSEMDSVIEAWYSRLNRQKSRNRGMRGDVSWIEIDYILIDTFLLVMSKDDGDVEYYNPYVKISENNIQDEVPEGLPYRTKTVIIDDSDPENIITEEQVKTWEEWFGVNYPPTIIEGYHYYVSAGGNKGKSLSGEELLIINNTTGVELIDSVPVIEETQDGE